MKNVEIMMVGLFTVGIGIGIFIGGTVERRTNDKAKPKLEVVAVNKATCKCGRESRVVIYEKGADE